MLPQKRTARMDRAGARTGEKKAHWEKTGGEGLGRGWAGRIESGLPENLKNRKIPYFGSSECLSHLIWGKLETLCKNCDACNH
jgi:hypothetical protein